MSKKIKIYVYGAGLEYNKLSSYLLMQRDRIEVLGIVTTQRQLFDSIDGYRCLLPCDIDVENMDYVVIASKAWKEIMKTLLFYGIDEEKVIFSGVFYNPCFDMDEYLRLKQNKVTILSNYCMGGMIYKELGLKTLSPTVNMICEGKMYLEFINNLQHYLQKDMVVFAEKDSGVAKRDFVPKGIIDNKIVWDFVHNAEAEDAVEKWNERRKRVNFDNIAVLMTIQTDEEAYLFDALPIEKKLGIYYKDLGLKNVIYLKEWNDSDLRMHYMYRWHVCANDCMVNSKSRVSRVNWIKFLNGERDYIRYSKRD